MLGRGPRRCAVLGSPIAHSLSPAMHRAAYAELGLEWSYDAIEVRPDGLAGFLDGLDDDWRGLSLTMPLKRTVVPLLDGLDAHAELSQVVNTVLLDEGRREGANTDVPGAAAALDERLDGPVASAVVLGGGATATSVLLALAGRGCRRADLVVREPARAQETLDVVRRHPDAPDLGVLTLADLRDVRADLVVSTVPAAAQTPEVVAAVAEVPAVFEVVYDPWPTPLAHAASESGRTLVSGIDLLAHQAALQVELMTGGRVDADLLRRAALAELGTSPVENAPQPSRDL